MTEEHLVIVARLGGALLIGALIGFERSFQGRPAGFRTHALVSVASALVLSARRKKPLPRAAHPRLSGYQYLFSPADRPQFWQIRVKWLVVASLPSRIRPKISRSERRPCPIRLLQRLQSNPVRLLNFARSFTKFPLTRYSFTSA